MTDPRRIEVWVLMAEQFLDTESRQDIPQIAMACVRAGLSISEARDVWRHEVFPAVGYNLFDVAGEWAGWPEDWLVEKIERLRTSRANRPSALRWLCDGLSVDLMRGVRLSIERCMEVLLAAPTRDASERMSRDLAALTSHYFKFMPINFDRLDPADRVRIRSLYPDPFRWMMSSALVLGEAKPAERRLRAALQLE